MMRRPRRSTLFPTPPLSRSRDDLAVGGREGELAEPLGGDPRHGLRLARLDRARLEPAPEEVQDHGPIRDRKSTRLNSSHLVISYAVFCLKKKKIQSSGLTLRAAVNVRLGVGSRPPLSPPAAYTGTPSSSGLNIAHVISTGTRCCHVLRSC